MRRSLLIGLLPLVLLGLPPLEAAAQDAAQPAPDQPALEQFYKRVSQSLVVVKYQWQGELAKQEIIGCGVVVREDGLVMVPHLLVYNLIPDMQMKDFKIVIPSPTEDETEIDATFVGRDERSNVGFVQAKGDRKWTAIHFEDRRLSVGQPVYGVGRLPKVAGYQPYLTEAKVSAQLRGEIPEVLVTGGLSNVGSAIFDAGFHAIGFVEPQEGQDVVLDGGRFELRGVVTPPHFFVPTRSFMQSLDDPPTVDRPIRTPWMGVPQLIGVNQQIARFLDLKNQPAVQVGDVVPGTPAAKAGLEPGNIIIKMNGQPLERGDLPEELPMIVRRQLLRMKIGDKVTFSVLKEKGMPPHDVTVTLAERPRQSNLAERFFAQDLGFVAREAVFTDAYEHKMKPDAVGVVIDLVRRDGAAASAKVGPDDWVMQLNGQPVTDLKQFRRDYQAFRKDHAKDAVVLVVQRSGGREETINIEPPQTDAAPGAGGDQP